MPEYPDSKPEIVVTYEKVACPFCGAERRVPCSSPGSGRPSQWPHAARIREAERHGLLQGDGDA